MTFALGDLFLAVWAAPGYFDTLTADCELHHFDPDGSLIEAFSVGPYGILDLAWIDGVVYAIAYSATNHLVTVDVPTPTGYTDEWWHFLTITDDGSVTAVALLSAHRNFDVDPPETTTPTNVFPRDTFEVREICACPDGTLLVVGDHWAYRFATSGAYLSQAGDIGNLHDIQFRSFDTNVLWGWSSTGAVVSIDALDLTTSLLLHQAPFAAFDSSRDACLVVTITE